MNNETTLRALDSLVEQRSQALAALQALLRFQTISAEYSDRKAEFAACAEWLVKALQEMGLLRCEILPTGGPPVVVAEWLEAENAPTLLIYGHYDVMPVDPLEAWQSPPFEPVIQDSRLYARGASDDKGQFYALLCAAAALIKAGGLPVNLKVLLEGEEEELSAHLGPFIRQNRERLRCDGIVIADMGGLDAQIPLIEYGTRGNCALEVYVQGPAKDLHSGTYGGAVDNPFNVLVRLLAQIQDGESRKILIPGFYDRVKELTTFELALAEEIPITDEVGLFFTGAPALGGEPEYQLKVRISARPTFEVHGIAGGYTGEGVKTVIPASASAKLSFRLVPDQSPDEVYALVSDFLQLRSPNTVRVTCKLLGSAKPATIHLESPVVRAAETAFQAGFGVPPRYVRGGGSLPILNILQEELQPEVLMTGFGLPQDNEHAPNESLSLDQFFRGSEMMVHYFAEYRKLMDESNRE